MKKSIQALFTLALLFVDTTFSHAQITMPAPSPLATLTQKVGINEVKIEYCRPSANGRKIFGELVPYGKIWRTGANAPTKFTLADSATIGGKKLPGGTYALYTIPGEKEWTIIFNPKSTVAAWDYKDGDEAVKFNVPVTTLAQAVETFTIDLGNLTRTNADVIISWERTQVKFTISTNPDAKIMAEIKTKTDNIATLWNAASYYYDNDKDMKQALEWINTVVEKNPRYWTWHMKAKIHEKLKDYTGAVAAAKTSLAMAEKDDDNSYVQMNKQLLARCEPLLPPAKSVKKK
jgi:hypothetical protein